MKHSFYSISSLAATALLFTACSDKEVNDIQNNQPIPDSQKEMISFSLSDGTGQTRAGFTGATTRIVARIQSDQDGTSNTRYTKTALKALKDETTDATTLLTSYSTVSYYDGNIRYWDDAFGRKAKLSVYAVAIPNSEVDTKLTFDKLTGGSTWEVEASPSNSIQWDVTHDAQTTTTLAGEDLVYSNNIQSGGKNGRYVWNYEATPQGYPEDNGRSDGHKDGQLVFTQKAGAVESDAGHFDKGHLVFNHALSRLTITLVEGQGFDNTSANKDNDFKFNKGTGNIKLFKFPTNGTLNIKSGIWDSYADANYTDIDQMIGEAATATDAKPAAASGKDTYVAQMLPGYKFTSTGTENVMQFTIDDNTYYITQKQVYEALVSNVSNKNAAYGWEEGTFTMKQGINYKLSITVNKTAINNVTATLVGWGEVVSENIGATNSYISISSSTMGAKTEKCDHFDLYRLDAGVEDIYTDQNGSTIPNKTNWGGNYLASQKATLTKDGSYDSNGKWTTNWYWDSNKSFYHFRTVDTDVVLQETSTGTDDYFNIYSGPVKDDWSSNNISVQVNDGKYNDYHWGAPMKKEANLTYNTKAGATTEGFTSSLYQAIGSTTDQINIIEQHMMSTVHFVLHTGTKSDGTTPAGAVALMDGSDKGTRLTLTNFAGSGQVKVGNGFITPATSYISSDIPVPGATSISYDTNNKLSSLVTSSINYYAVNDATNKKYKTKEYSYRVVPQPLYRGSVADPSSDNTLTNFVGLTIVTPDDNQYYVIKSLYGVNGTISSTSKTEHGSGSASITRWYPGYDYTYHIYINKTGIENITCTVVDWVNVEGTIGDINLES